MPLFSDQGVTEACESDENDRQALDFSDGGEGSRNADGW